MDSRRRSAALFAVLALTLLPLFGCSGNSDTSNSANGDGDQSSSSKASATDSPASDDASTDGPAPNTKPLTKESIARLLRRGDDLYEEVSALPDNVPTTQMGASELVNGDQGPIGSFYAKDRAFQGDIPKANLAKDPANLINADGNLAEFETFAYSTASAVASCNGADARRDLKVAKAYLDEAHRDYEGTASENWEPPSTADDDTNSEDCEQ